MRWGMFIVALFVTLTLELSMKPLFYFPTVNNLAPSFVIVLLVFVSLLTPRLTLMWAALLMGLLIDLATPESMPGGAIVYLIGPHAIGFVAAAYGIVQMRAVVFRQRLVTIVALTFVAFLAVAIVRILIMGVRGWFGEELVWGGGSALGELWHAALVAVYSSVIALPFGWMLLQTVPLWGFATSHQRVTAWR